MEALRCVSYMSQRPSWGWMKPLYTLVLGTASVPCKVCYIKLIAIAEAAKVAFCWLELLTDWFFNFTSTTNHVWLMAIRTNLFVKRVSCIIILYSFQNKTKCFICSLTRAGQKSDISVVCKWKNTSAPGTEAQGRIIQLKTSFWLLSDPCISCLPQVSSLLWTYIRVLWRIDTYREKWMDCLFSVKKRSNIGQYQHIFHLMRHCQQCGQSVIVALPQSLGKQPIGWLKTWILHSTTTFNTFNSEASSLQ